MPPGAPLRRPATLTSRNGLRTSNAKPRSGCPTAFPSWLQSSPARSATPRARGRGVEGSEEVKGCYRPDEGHAHCCHSRRVALLGVASLAGIPAASVVLWPGASDAGVQQDIVQLARREPDPEIALELWDQALEERSSNDAIVLLERGYTNLRLRLFEAAISDLGAAAPLLRDVRSGEVVYLSTSGRTPPIESAYEALAYDGVGLAQMQLGDADGAIESFRRALGTAGTTGTYDTAVPDNTPYSGLRGGAAKLGQRLELHAGLARLAAGDLAGATQVLRQVDKGPDPDGTSPQFWDARAALAVSLSASGDTGAAELEWADLCRPTLPPPPATPNNPLFARVNQAAQGMLAAEGMMTDRNCEDFETGVYLPCDDAGIPGLGGSSSPCALYTADEVAARLWPPAAVRELQAFRNRSPEQNAQALARGVLQNSN